MIYAETVRELVEKAAAQYSDAPAITENIGGAYVDYSFSRLKRDVERTAKMLIAKGCRGAHIGIHGVNSYSWAVAFYAVCSGVGVAVPIPTGIPAENVLMLARAADVSVILDDDENLSLPGVETLKLAPCEEDIDAIVPVPVKDDVCELIFTSGTTGIPKGVLLSQGNIMSIATCDFMPYAGKVSVSVLPLSHAFESSCHLLVYTAAGSRLYMCPSFRMFPVMVAESGCDILYLVPALVQALLTRLQRYLDKAVNLKRVVCGGAHIPQSMADALAARGIQMLSGYGLSECSPLVCLNVESIPGSVGRICSHNEVRVSEEGELQIRGSNVTRGYYKNEAATKAAFTEDGWFKTGDLGYVDENNHLFLTGRIKNLIILSNGENVSPEEIETLVIDSVPEAADALCYDDNDRLAVKIFAGGDVSDETLARIKSGISKLNESLPSHKRVSGVSLTAEPLPVNATGKKIR